MTADEPASLWMDLGLNPYEFLDHEEQLRDLSPEDAAVIYDLTPDGESELWAIAEPGLGTGCGTPEWNHFIGTSSVVPNGTVAANGARIIEAYRQNNPDVTALSLIKVTTEEIYADANYDL